MHIIMHPLLPRVCVCLHNLHRLFVLVGEMSVNVSLKHWQQDNQLKRILLCFIYLRIVA